MSYEVYIKKILSKTSYGPTCSSIKLLHSSIALKRIYLWLSECSICCGKICNSTSECIKKSEKYLQKYKTPK